MCQKLHCAVKHVKHVTSIPCFQPAAPAIVLCPTAFGRALQVGVVLVTINSGNTTTSNPAAGADLALGLGASALSGLSSAYAGVYFEKYLKGKDAGTLWVRNMQLSIYGLAFSTIYMFVKDGHEVASGGIHQGFDWIAWAVVGLQVHAHPSSSLPLLFAYAHACRHTRAGMPMHVPFQIVGAAQARFVASGLEYLEEELLCLDRLGGCGSAGIHTSLPLCTRKCIKGKEQKVPIRNGEANLGICVASGLDSHRRRAALT